MKENIPFKIRSTHNNSKGIHYAHKSFDLILTKFDLHREVHLINFQYFTDVLLPNNYTIKVIDKESKKVYTITAEKFKKKGQFYHFKREKEDDQAQIFCSRRFWDIPKEIPTGCTTDMKPEEAKKFAKMYL